MYKKGPNKVQASQVNCKICLNQLVCMSFVVGFGWFWVVLFEGKSPHMKTFLICDGLPGQEKFRQFSRWILPGFVQSMNFIAWSRIWSIYIPVWPIYLQLSFLSEQQFFCRLFEISSHGKFRINPCFWDSDCSFFSKTNKKLVSRLQSQINPKFPVTATNLKLKTTYRRIFVCWEKMNEKDVLTKEVCKCFIDMRNEVNWWYEGPILEQLMRKCCPIFYCPDRPSKLRHLIIWWLALEPNPIGLLH